jgi:hypothetical protein
MKFSNSFATAGFAALALASASVLASANSAQALSIYYSPTGSNIDSDGIPDIVTAPGSTVSFDVFLETFGIPNAPSDPGVSAVEYLLKWDVAELELASTQFFSPLFLSSVVTPPAPVPGAVSFAQNGFGSIAPWTANVKLATFSFKVLAGLTSDGVVDFSTDLTKVFNSGGGTFADSLISTQIQKVEVQGATAIPTPALLPGLAALGFGAIRKRKAKAAVA